ncbi:MAG: tetratricopeptide repeat protein [Planctomycetes bacterium]|nr:tetratricopeptide repeat protein [Planctomycetota bacterium]
MAIRFSCSCGKRLSVPDERAGVRVRCPGCGKAIAVPAPETESGLDASRTAVFGPGPAGGAAERTAALPAGAEPRAARQGGSFDAIWALLGKRPPGEEERGGREGGQDERGEGEPPCEGPALGRYPVAGSIGKGGMGEVLLVRDPEIGRELAAKVILGGAGANRRLVEKFLLEAQVTGQLEHPNIVPVHELALSPDGRVFFTMKRVKGRDLAALLADARAAAERASSSSSARLRAAGSSSGARKARGTHPADPASEYSLVRLLEVFLKVCDAVAFAHSRGVIHRDLKPANIMVGEFGEVLVMDWGLAKTLGQPDPAADAVTPNLAGAEVARRARGREAGEEPVRTLDGAILGTPSYMPPEQARGETSALDERSDIYSLGAILYEILALAPAFAGKSSWAILEKVMAGELVPPSARSPGRDLPRDLEAAVMKAMAPAQNDRYESAGALKADIEAYLAGRTLAAADYSPLQVLAKWAKRNKVAVAGGAATTVALLAGLLGIVFVLGRAEAEKLREAERARLEEKAATDRARTSEAEALWARGRAAWDEAERIPFNRAAPQDYFRPHVAALSAMGRSLQIHPGPPADLARELARFELDAQEKAETAGDWAMAQILAESAGSWGAVDTHEAEVRLARVEEARAGAAKDAEATLRDILARIGKAEGPGKKGGALIPGEIPERARRLALHGPPELTALVIAMLADEKKDMSAAEREFLIEFLGRKGDVHAEHEGFTAPEVVLAALERAKKPGVTPAAEVAQWLWAAARLEAREPGTLKDVAELANSLASAYEGLALVTNAARDALAYLAAIRDKAPLPSLAEDGGGAGEGGNRAEFEHRLEELADWAAATVRSKGDHTRLLLDLAEEGSLSARQLAFVYGELGLMAFADPPDPARPDRTAAAALRAVFDRSFPPIRVAAKERKEPPGDAITLAAAAAEGLSRLGDGGFTLVLTAARLGAGEFSVFGTRTGVALALLPPISTEPAGAVEHSNRGTVRYAQGDFTGAIEDYTRAIELDPKNAGAHDGRGNARTQQGDLAGAIEDFTRAIEIDPKSASTYNNRGIARSVQGEIASAIEDFTRAIELDPKHAGAYSNRGVARYEQGDLAAAIEDYTRAIDLDPKDVGVYYNRGIARRDQGELAAAIQDYTLAIELDPRFAAAYTNRGIARKAQGNLAGAIEDHTRAIELNPTDAAAHNSRGIDRYNQGDLAGAIDDYARAIELDPNFAMAYSNRGLARSVQGDLSGAIEDYARTIELAPNLWQAWMNRAIALAQLGKREEARASFERALAVCPPDARAQVEGARREFLGE